MKVLALNYGSSSIKFLMAESRPSHDMLYPLGRGSIDGIGTSQSTLRLYFSDRPPVQESLVATNHTQGTTFLFDHFNLYEEFSPSTIHAVGHRVVHGGDVFTQPTVVNAGVLSTLERLCDLAPLHNPLALKGIQETRTILGESVAMVCVFDTAFHHDMPKVASTYAIPHELATRHHIKRYGFHGIAHASLVQGYVTHRGESHQQDRVISLHLGNGCSITASKGGRSVDTSMGFTPLEGLVMGTRSGDLDPALVNYLAEKEHVTCAEVEKWLNHKSGLLGVSGQSSDMRMLLEAANHNHDEQATLAIDLFCYRARKYIGAYLATLGGAEAIIFGGGIGEASPDIRQRICENLEWCGLQLEPTRNEQAIHLSPGMATCITKDQAHLPAYVVAADEEMLIAQQTVECLTRSNTT
ncbi:acetate/propionate family kinase [Candidatus Nitronereus thalassa]|uniref:Acetate kinase n=1 Tax=Candidatus Nitronereus thalassa TaxID=3020898 RepID=A0ABU3K8Z4_9BACT|nr:acetate/propionate family kinase [Candidatus Nitronereus thalassa]MDT7042875.1 acetate/propionate family kinase [Candidatus Nitronereus thalassa]